MLQAWGDTNADLFAIGKYLEYLIHGCLRCEGNVHPVEGHFSWGWGVIAETSARISPVDRNGAILSNRKKVYGVLSIEVARPNRNPRRKFLACSGDRVLFNIAMRRYIRGNPGIALPHWRCIRDSALSQANAGHASQPRDR